MAGHRTNGLDYFIFANILLLICFAVLKVETEYQDRSVTNKEVQVRQSPTDVYALRHNPLKINCGISLPLLPLNSLVLEFWWLKDGKPISNNTTRVQYSSLDLSFMNIVQNDNGSANDAGKYRCLLKLQTGMVLGPITRLFIANLSKNAEDEVMFDGVVNQNVVLPCGISSIPFSQNVSWIKIQGQMSSRYMILNSGNLLIKHIQETDKGSFRCRMNNNLLHEAEESDVHLNVHQNNSYGNGEPEILETFSDRINLRDSSTELICVSNGNPRPTIKWALTDEGDARNRIVISLDEKIYLSSQNASGNYTCIAGVGAQEATKTVYAYHEPSFIDLQPIYVFPAAKTVRFECKSLTAPVTWIKDGVKLVNKGRVKIRSSELVISNTVLSDNGFYQCESEDYIGTTRLIVQTRENLEAPVQLTCESDSSKTVQIMWKVTYGGNIQAFSIHYAAIDGASEERQLVTNNTTTSLLIENLLPNTNYSVYVRSYSGRAASSQSERVICSTFEDLPVAAPKLNLPDQLGPPTQYRLKWTPLSNIEARGKIVLYKLQWRVATGNYTYTNLAFLRGDAEEFTLTGLKSSTHYLIRLLPATRLGYALRSEWTNIFTSEEKGNYSFTSPALQVTFANSSALEIVWNVAVPPEHTLRVIRLVLGKEEDILGSEMIYEAPFEVDFQQSSYLFNDLDQSTQYQVSVQAVSDTWESEVAVKNVRTANGNTTAVETEFSALSGLQARPEGTTKVTLSWNKPEKANVEHYVVRYNALDSHDPTFLQSEKERITVDNLRPFTIYEFAVGYHDMSGFVSPFSKKVETTTREGRPSPPLGVTYQVLNKSSIQISWQHPVYPNGEVTRYQVELQDSSQVSSLVYSSSTNIVLTNLKPNNLYYGRVAAETNAGVGTFTEPLKIKIFSNSEKFASEERKDISSNNSTGGLFEGTSEQQLGLIFGTTLGLISICLCALIIIYRNRCFALITRTRIRQVNGRANGKDAVDSAPVEMKVLNSDPSTILDTKGGHPNGLIKDEVHEPLLHQLPLNPVRRAEDLELAARRASRLSATSSK